MRAALLSIALILGLVPGASATETVLVPAGAEWRYFEGLSDPSEPLKDWTRPEFNDSGWKSGPSGIGYADGDDATVLGEMAGRYLSVYTRIEFDVVDPATLGELVLSLRYDDGFVAWLNGAEVARSGLTGTPPSRHERATDHEATISEDFAIGPAARRLVAGRNVLAIEIHNSALNSSDLSLVPVLVATALARPLVEPEVQRDLADISGVETVMAPPEPATRDGARRTFTARTELSNWWTSNYFESRGPVPRTSVIGLHVRQQISARPRTFPSLVATFRVEGNRAGSLGTSAGWSANLAWRWGAQSLRVDVPALYHRPAYQIAGRILTADDYGLTLDWSWAAPHRLEVGAWIAGRREHVKADSTRDNRDVTAGASLRFLRDHVSFSPEIGYETTWRQAPVERYDYEQRRLYFRFTSSPVRRLYLSGLLRHAIRDYTASSGPSAGRSDDRDVIRLLLSWRATSRLGVNGYVEHEEGGSNSDSFGLSADTVWVGLSLSY